ncbi:hypothetical protein PZ938_13755 [Luteipulveratus sp. YIM 133132]|uniref:hypothetical protein n=1 Tax=Luteipulveratus flavus TaxID=3031728 RepID=UPI0023AF66E1|nr:hypothetical protein [Luteipulveratus sp. YIM 133132]MDE9366674.1 hypothetical protein [Luteipulveratus sp. YIM 133132]
MSISTRTKTAAIVAAAICIAGPATASLANGLGSDDPKPVPERAVPGPAGHSLTSERMRTMAGLPARSCGVTAKDRTVASRISGRVHSDNLNGINAEQLACARRIVSATKSKGLNGRAAQIALMTAQAETSLRNLKGGDRDSYGLFQQRPSQGWGTVAQVMNPDYATKKFLSVMQQFHPNGSWKRGDMGAIAQSVQRSAYPAEYGKEQGAAGVILDALWPGSGGSSGNPYTAVEVCGKGYTVIDSQAIGKAGRAYLLYNKGNGRNCVTTLKATSLGKKSAVSTFLEVKGARRTTDSGSYSYYAGPISKAAAGKCVKWGGSVGAQRYASPFEHCG